MNSLNFEPAKIQKRIKKTARRLKINKYTCTQIHKKLSKLRKISSRVKRGYKTYKFRNIIRKINFLTQSRQCYKIKTCSIKAFVDWKPELEEYLHANNIHEVDVSVSKNQSFSGHYSEHMVSTIDLKTFFNYDGDYTMYIAQLSLFENGNNDNDKHEKLTKILSDFGLQEFCKSFFESIERINLWASLKETNSSLHYDSYDNFMFVLKGKKKFTVFKPNDKSIACESVLTNSYQQAKMISDKPGKGIEITLNEGEGIFVPQGWYHKVDSQGDDGILAINIWFDSVEKICTAREKYLFRYLANFLIEKEIKELLKTYQTEECYSNIDLIEWPEFNKMLKNNNVTYFEVILSKISFFSIRDFFLKASENDSIGFTRLLMSLSPMQVELLTKKLEDIDNICDTRVSELKIISKSEFYDRLFSIIDFSQIQKSFLDSKKELRKQIFESVIVQKMINSYHF